MKIVDLRPGLQVLHPQFGLGEVKVLTEKNAEVLFNDGRKMLTEEVVAELKPAEALAKFEGLEKPLRDLIAEVVEATAEKLNLKVDMDEFAPQLAPRWVGGKVVLRIAGAEGGRAGSFLPKDRDGARQPPCAGTENQRASQARRCRADRVAALHHEVVWLADNVQSALQGEGADVLI
jgi:hypothetical protein